MVGLDAAASFSNITGVESRVLLHADYWNGHSFPGRLSKHMMGPNASYSWASRLVALPIADSSSTMCSRTVSTTVSALLDGSAMRRLRLSGASDDCMRVEPGSPYACGGQWCRIAGSYDRSTLELRRRSAELSSHLSAPERVSAPVRVLWHFRTGDAIVSLRRDSVARLHALLAAGFERRGVEHRVCTYDEQQLHATYPWLRKELRLVQPRGAHEGEHVDVSGESSLGARAAL